MLYIASNARRAERATRVGLSPRSSILCLTNLRRREGQRPANVFAATLRGTHTSHRAFAQDVSLELRDGAEHGIKQPASGGSRVDVVRQRTQRNLALT